MAGEIRGFQCQHVAIAEDDPIYQDPARAPSEDDIRGGVPEPAQKTSDRLRRTISVGVNSVVPSGLTRKAIGVPTLKRWAIFANPSGMFLTREPDAQKLRPLET